MKKQKAQATLFDFDNASVDEIVQELVRRGMWSGPLPNATDGEVYRCLKSQGLWDGPPPKGREELPDKLVGSPLHRPPRKQRRRVKVQDHPVSNKAIFLFGNDL